MKSIPTFSLTCSPFVGTITRFFTLALLAGSAQAAELARYDFNGYPTLPTPTDARTAYPTLTRGAYVNDSLMRAPSDPANMSYLVYTLDPYNYPNPWDGNVMSGKVRANQAGAGVFIVNDAAAITRDAWFAVTYTPTAGTSFNSISLDAAATVIALDDPEFRDVLEVGMVLRSSLTGWGAGDALGSAVITAGMQMGEQQQITFDLSGVSALQNVTQPVTFRFYVNTNGANTSPNFYVDDLTLNGVQAVPEPGSIALLVGGGAFLFVRRFRAAGR